eukprot:TRINITY_DN5882_c0_g1_i1.p3 TRINITY_DN5882_c0_g1~~TRINITY_DN5882_c0_g1_i1.p3  ORF type:complete len:144 (+),score=59.39 TRINITY_DN5882_c0_g1_i1:82-513(+)
MDAVKALSIKVGSVKRTKKEYEMYLKEEVQQRERIEKMKADGKDEYDVKKQMEVLNDTLTVIPDTRARLQKYLAELSDALETEYKDVDTIGHAGSGEPADEAGEKLKELVLEGRQLLKDCDVEKQEEKEADAGCGGTGEEPEI